MRTLMLSKLWIFLLLLLPQASWATDPEGCLLCHRYRGLGRLDDTGDRVKLFYVDPFYYDRTLGSHARLYCTDCHNRSEVEVLPHMNTSPVDCTQSCHLESASNLEVS